MVDIGTADDQVKTGVEAEPVIDFKLWLEFQEADFRNDPPEKNLLAIYNYTSVHDSQAYINSRIDARGVIIEKGQAPALLDIVKNHPRRSHFVEGIDRMVGSPDTDTYSNPSDVVWMNWIGETQDGEAYYLPPDGEEKFMNYTVTSVTRSSVNGESEIYIPSKYVRELLGIVEMSDQVFVDRENQVKAINHNISLPNYDRQEITVVPKDEFLQKLDSEGKEMVWFVEVFRVKNALNEAIKSEQHPMKTRKYFVWYENGEFKWEKFWDARFSNTREEGPRRADEDDDSDDWQDFDIEIGEEESVPEDDIQNDSKSSNSDDSSKGNNNDEIS